MATVFETRLIGNIGRDATSKTMDKGMIAISFPVAHNKNWKDRKTGESKTKTTWVNCTIWKKEGTNLKILDFLKKGCLVELYGTPVAKAYQDENETIRAEIKLNVEHVNILKNSRQDSGNVEDITQNDSSDGFDSLRDFTIDEDDF
ncbi:MAG: single-stranded DNA-binding protein [Bacteroidota bacterium]